MHFVNGNDDNNNNDYYYYYYYYYEPNNSKFGKVAKKLQFIGYVSRRRYDNQKQRTLRKR